MPKVIFYYIPTCHHCVDARKYLEQRKIDFDEVNIATDREGLARMKQLTNQVGAPVFEIGNKVIIGFNIDKLNEAFKSNGFEGW